LSLLEVVEVLHVTRRGGAVVHAGAVEPLVLGAVEAEPLLLGAVPVAEVLPCLAMLRTTFLAQAFLALHVAMGAKAFPVAIPANDDPIPAFMAKVY